MKNLIGAVRGSLGLDQRRLGEEHEVVVVHPDYVALVII